MYCHKCGIPIPENNKFCHQCGQIINAPIQGQNIQKNQPSESFRRIIIIILVTLFVMAGIGILASVVLTSMIEARAKARDAQIEMTLKNILPKAEIYSSLNNGYLGFCNDPEIKSLTSVLMNSSSTEPYNKITCNDSVEAYAISVMLSNSNDIENDKPIEYFCVDSTGVATTTTNDISINGNTSCSIYMQQVFENNSGDGGEGFNDPRYR